MIGIIGDIHFKESLGYADYISDRRLAEKKTVLDFIVQSFSKCDTIVMMGDQLNSKNNTSEVIREFVEFTLRFKDKKAVYMIAGNHEKRGDGKTAIDFLKEIPDTNIRVYTTPETGVLLPNGMKADFLPFMLKSELGVLTDKEGSNLIMKMICKGNDVLFAHHAISDTLAAGMSTNLFNEIVLPNKELAGRYKAVVAGHIHSPQQVGNVTITGSVFNNVAGELGKSIWIMDDSAVVKEIPLPGRKIYHLTNVSASDVAEMNIPNDSIVKVTLTEKQKSYSELIDLLKGFAAFLVIENYPNERKKIDFQEGAFDFSIENVLKLYAKEKAIDPDKLIKGLELIR